MIGGKTMYYLIAYDVASARRLRCVATVCKNYGIRIQKSLFECHLEKADFAQLWKQLCEITKRDEDTLVAYPICGACLKAIRQNRPHAHPEAPLCYVV